MYEDPAKDRSARRISLLELAGTPMVDPVAPSPTVYHSRDVLDAETTKLWPKTWLMAGREEEVPQVGDYIEFRIANQAIIVVRTAEDRLDAYHNVCQHRGRALVSGPGHAKQFRCGFHGWRWNLDGTCAEMLYEHEFVSVCRKDVPLKSVQCAAWGGFIFVNMDLEAPSFEEYMAPALDFLAPFELEKMRFRWSKSAIAQSNWKIAMEAFLEQYHLVATHPQYAPYFDDRTLAIARGLHSQYIIAPDSNGYGGNSPEVELKDIDWRKQIYNLAKVTEDQLRAIYTPVHMKAAERVLEMPEGVSLMEAYQCFSDEVTRIARETGVGEFTISDAEMNDAGINWHLFPNMVILPNPAGALVYRFRPNGNDPESCLMQVWSLARFAPGEEPDIEHEFYDDWREGNFGAILEQDFTNMAEVQRGTSSLGLTTMRLNPVQELAVANFHRNLAQFIN